MIWHPLVLAVVGLDLLGLLALLFAAAAALQVLLHWAPESAAAGQIILERRAETGALAAGFGFWALLAASLLLVIGITNVLPELVPGAMCGTGVLQATAGAGPRALGFRLGALVLLCGWRMVETVNRRHPLRPLTLPAARLLLLALPLCLLAAGATFQALAGLDVHQPVDCCAVVYDQFRPPEIAGRAAGLPDRLWVGLFALGGVVLGALSLRLARAPDPIRGPWPGALAGVALLWAGAAAVALVRVLAAYTYEVLHHHCPWCLFLPEHRFVGFPLFGLLMLTVLEGCGVWTLALVVRRCGLPLPGAASRLRAGGWRILWAAVLFSLLAAAPALWWRWRFGVWIGG
jgi:hypothetical protein